MPEPKLPRPKMGAHFLDSVLERWLKKYKMCDDKVAWKQTVTPLWELRKGREQGISNIDWLTDWLAMKEKFNAILVLVTPPKCFVVRVKLTLGNNVMLLLHRESADTPGHWVM